MGHTSWAAVLSAGLVQAPQDGQPVVPSPQGVVRITNSQKTNKLSSDSVWEVPRTNNDEFNAAQSPVLNNNQLSKKVYISEPPHRNKEGIGGKRKRSSFDYKAEWDTLCWKLLQNQK
jgi:hypothetical protein